MVLTGNLVYGRAGASVCRQAINKETERPLLTGALTPRQHFLHENAFLDFFPARLLPVDDRPQVGSEKSLVEDVVCHVRKPLQLWSTRPRGELDTLSDMLGPSVVTVDVCEPQHRWNVLDDEL